MDISGLVDSYEFRAASPATLTQEVMGSQYLPVQAFKGAPANHMVVAHPQIQQNYAFSFAPYFEASQNGLSPAYPNNYVQRQLLPRQTQFNTLYAHNPQGFIEAHHSQSQPIRPEQQWNGPVSSPLFLSANAKTITATAHTTDNNGAKFGTEVDTLMKAIQAKSQTIAPPQKSSFADHSLPVVGVFCTPPSGDPSQHQLTQKGVQEEASPTGGKKRYQCTIPDCNKSFGQGTHLVIHERAHTGVKPYPCKEPGCGRSFSQLGNLKTHERRHTGERPYKCEICGKKFAQRGNVRAHKIVHEKRKPYHCRLDDCGKRFTQLGNLKSHQNKFHIATIRALTTKFASVKDGDIVPATDKELWEYFANLYKNSNKGIKGRGKDRKVSSESSSAAISGGQSGHYEMSHIGAESQFGNDHHGSVSSDGTGDNNLPCALTDIMC